jgi:G3E family GTPase
MIRAYVLSGYLGSGKTELAKAIIRENQKKEIVIIENEISELGVDGKLLPGNVRVIEINDGSIGSVNLENFRRAVSECLSGMSPQMIIVEESGAAELSPALSVLSEFEALEIIPIAVIDAERFSKARMLSSHTIDQIGNASLVILNKADLVRKDELEKQLANIRKLNCNVISAVMCSLEKGVLDSAEKIECASLEKTGKGTSYFLWKIKNNLGIRGNPESHSGISAYVYYGNGIVSEEILKKALKMTGAERAKGFIRTIEGFKSFSYVPNSYSSQESSDSGINKIVVIGEKAFARRDAIKRMLSPAITKDFNDRLSDLAWFFSHQENVSQRLSF